MNNEFENIIKAVKNIKLTEDEKFLMRKNLLANFAPAEIEEYQDVRGFKNTRLYYFMTNGYRYKFAPAMILLIVLAGGTSAFAEKALPGDFLYGIKIFVNESVGEVLALANGKKAEWQEQLVERRLGEAQKLIAKNNFNETNRIYLAGKIKSQVDQFSASANKLALETNESASSSALNIRLQASLEAHQNVLATLSGDTNIDADTKQETGALLAVLAESQDQVKDDQKNLELNTGLVSATAPVSDSAFAKQKEALGLFDSTKLLYEQEKINLSVDLQSQINAKLADIEVALAEGKTFIDSSDYVNATDKFQLEITLLNETSLLILSNVIKGEIEESINPQS